MKYKFNITYEDGHIEHGVVDEYIFKTVSAWALSNDYILSWELIQ